MTKEQIEEFSKKLYADGNEYIMLVLCDDNLAVAMNGTSYKLSISLAGVALNDDEFRTVFEEAIKMYEKVKKNSQTPNN